MKNQEGGRGRYIKFEEMRLANRRTLYLTDVGEKMKLTEPERKDQRGRLPGSSPVAAIPAVGFHECRSYGPLC